jgi:hypothetical protein
MSSASQPSASFAIAELSLAAGTGAGVLDGIPGLCCGTLCAAHVKLIASIHGIPAEKILFLRFQLTKPSSSTSPRSACCACLSKRFASNELHTNMQVWASVPGIPVALPKFNVGG